MQNPKLPSFCRSIVGLYSFLLEIRGQIYEKNPKLPNDFESILFFEIKSVLLQSETDKGMNQNGIYNLEEFTNENGFQSFGSALACNMADREILRGVKHPGKASSFYMIVLMIDGWEKYLVNRNPLELEMHDLFVKLPYDSFLLSDCSNEVSSIHLLAEKNYFDEILSQNVQLSDYGSMDIFSSLPVFHLSETKAASFFNSLDNIRRSILLPHLYKGEIIKYQIHILQLMLAELMTGEEVNTHDMKHKDNILKIFLHLASRNFKKERQIQFYAERMNITSTYLSRIVKELTGNTVFSYLSNFLYNEICIQLKTTDKTISEIADDLNFNDQSALTNFFRTKSGMSPLAYRKK